METSMSSRNSSLNNESRILFENVTIAVQPKKSYIRLPIKWTDGHLQMQKPLHKKGFYKDVDPESSIITQLRTRPKQFANAIKKRLKSVDGIDELASSIAQIRGLTGPIAAEAVFLGGFPFVILGFIGMLEESAEAREALDELSRNKEATLEQLHELVKKHSGNKEDNIATDIDPKNKKDRRFLRNVNKVLANINANLPENTKERLEVLTEFSKRFAELKDLESKKTETQLDCAAAPFGNAALGGMSVAMVPGMAWGATEIATRSMGQSAPETAAAIAGASDLAAASSVLSAATSAIFLPANILMVGYGTLRAIGGVTRNKRLERSQQRVEEFIHPENDNASNQGGKIFDEYMQADRHTNNLSRVYYGLITSASQNMLTAGGSVTIASFAGAAVGIGSGGAAIPILGATGAIGAAVMRIRAEIKEEIRHGKEERTPNKIRINFDEQYKRACQETTSQRPVEKQLINNYTTILQETSDDLARNKILSLAIHAIKRTSSEQSRKSDMDKWLFKKDASRGTLWGKGTSINKMPTTMATMKKGYYNYSNDDKILNETALAEAFSHTNKGTAICKLMQSEGHDDPAQILQILKDTNQLNKFAKKFSLSLMKLNDLPKQEQNTKYELRAEEKLLSLAFKAFSRKNSSEGRMYELSKLVHSRTKGYSTRLNKEERTELNFLYSYHKGDRENWKGQSTLYEAMKAPSHEEFLGTLTKCGFNQKRIDSYSERYKFIHTNDSLTSSENEDSSLCYSKDNVNEDYRSKLTDKEVPKEDVIARGPFGLFHSTSKKNSYELNINTLMNKLKQPDDKHTKLLDIFYQTAAPLMINEKKNISKVRMYDAVQGLDKATEFAQQQQDVLHFVTNNNKINQWTKKVERLRETNTCIDGREYWA